MISGQDLRTYGRLLRAHAEAVAVYNQCVTGELGGQAGRTQIDTTDINSESIGAMKGLKAKVDKTWTDLRRFVDDRTTTIARN